MQLLLADPRVEVNYSDCNGDTPLHCVSLYYSRANMMQLLLADPRVDVNYKNDDSQTPLMMALVGRYRPHLVEKHISHPYLVEEHISTLRPLLDHPTVDFDTTDMEGRGLKELAR